MIRKGDIYKVQAGTDSQQESLVAVMSSDDSNASAFANVTVLPVLSGRKGVAAGLEVAFKLGTEEVKVQPPNLTALRLRQVVLSSVTSSYDGSFGCSVLVRFKGSSATARPTS